MLQYTVTREHQAQLLSYELFGIIHGTICLKKLNKTIKLHIHFGSDHIIKGGKMFNTIRTKYLKNTVPSQGPRHTKDVIKMVPVVPLFGNQH